MNRTEKAERILSVLRRSECLDVGEIAIEAGLSESATRSGVKLLVADGSVQPMGESSRGGRCYATAEYAASLKK